VVSAALDAWVRGKNDEISVDEGCYFDLKAADRVRRFFVKTLCHSKGEWAGKPFELLDWQWEGVIAPLFGWKRKNGTRRFRKAGVWIPKKNGKSALGSGLSLYMLVGDEEPGAEVYNAAADKEQASIVYNEAANMVEASPVLSKRLDVRRSTKRINYPAQRSWYKALSADVPTKEGINWHFLCFDELHAQKTRDMWDTLAYGGAARRQPLMLSISTAGYDRQTIGGEQYDYAKGVLNGSIQDTSFFAYIAEAEESDDWTDPEIWHKANPSLGVTISVDSMRDDCKEAQNSPVKENAFRRYRLNQWTQQDVRWLSLDKWDLCGEPFDRKELEGRQCVVGIDLGATSDLTAAVAVFPPEDETGEFYFVGRYYMPDATLIDREREARAPYLKWKRDGLLTTTPGAATDYAFLRRDVNRMAAEYDVRAVLIDRNFNAAHIANELREQDGFEVQGFGQGYVSMSAPSKLLETLILSQRIRHGGDPILRWMANNVAAEMDAAGNIKPAKNRSGGKIDGIVAAIMGLAGSVDPRFITHVTAKVEVW